MESRAWVRGAKVEVSGAGRAPLRAGCRQTLFGGSLRRLRRFKAGKKLWRDGGKPQALFGASGFRFGKGYCRIRRGIR